MNTIKVISGTYKGKRIPFKNDAFDNADITGQKVKEALFSIIDPIIKNSSFLDLFAASGQMGLEALSRGSAFAAFNDFDKKRFDFIKNYIDTVVLNKDSFVIVNFHFERALRWFANKDYKFDIIFVDPPYPKNNYNEFYLELLDLISSLNLLNDDGIVVVQHYSENNLDEKMSNLVQIKRKNYSRTSLTFYTGNK
jgi:16S rRNA (guanine(966)-N(2))-methyltransferase RsmD